MARLASGVVQAPAPSHVGRQLNRGEEKVVVEQQILVAVLAALAGYNYQHQQSVKTNILLISCAPDPVFSE